MNRTAEQISLKFGIEIAHRLLYIPEVFSLGINYDINPDKLLTKASIIKFFFFIKAYSKCVK